jgi:hypothetical protein
MKRRIAKPNPASSTVTVAVIQAASVAFDRKRTLAKALDLTRDAAKRGAQLVLFPEAFISGYPRGLDFLAVTDHNTISHHAELAAASRRYGIILLPGQEVTTDGGHAGALGDVGWIDFREEPDAWLDATEAAGGLLSVNHPFAGPVSWTRPMRRRPSRLTAPPGR